MPRARRSNAATKKGNASRGSLRQELLQLKVSDKLNHIKGSRTAARADSEASEDEGASDILSHCSSASESVSVAEEGSGSDAQDFLSAQEQREDKLKEDIDNVTDKSAKTRITALGSLRLGLSSQVLGDFLTERRVTLTDALERCLKKGKDEEQSLAATVLSLLCIQLGSGSEGEEVFHCLKPILISILTDSSAGMTARQSENESGSRQWDPLQRRHQRCPTDPNIVNRIRRVPLVSALQRIPLSRSTFVFLNGTERRKGLTCTTALGLCCFIAAADVEDLVSCLSVLEGILTLLYSENNGTPPSQQGLVCCAIQSWALLLTICPASRIQKTLESHLALLTGALACENVNLRIAAGESLALLYELARDLDEDFFSEDTDSLCVTLKQLATDSNKYRAKTERRKQRSIFRDVLHYIESSECQDETIKFGLEVMYVDSWARRRMYSSFKEALGSGVRHHLQHNEVLRDIFSLGPPLVLDAAAIKASKISRVEKHMFNSAAFKARTKARNKVRDKRADVL